MQGSWPSEPDIKEMNGGVEVTVFAKDIDVTSGGQEGGQINSFISDFGNLSTRVKTESVTNRAHLTSAFAIFSDYFRYKFGRNSVKPVY